MLDIKQIRENPEVVKKRLQTRGNWAVEPLTALLRLDGDYRKSMQEVEQIRAEKRKASNEVGRFKREGKDVQAHLKQLKEVSDQETALSKSLSAREAEIKELLLNIPNLPHDSVPVGKDAKSNQVVRTWGEPVQFDFQPRTHMELAEHLGLIDFARAAKISGSNFVLFTGLGARLERGLIHFMLDLHTKQHGYTELSPPHLVNRASMTGTGQLPKFEEDMYRLKDDDLFLIPTAEVPVTNIFAGEMLEAKSLPRFYTAYTACFRREAGSYGKETKGLTRVHQFDKVEMVKFVSPENSYNELESLVENAEKVLQLLELPYRIVALSTGDISFSAAKCYDFEAWSAGTGNWLEVSSCSNFEDFQARRANIRFRDRGGGSGAVSANRSQDPAAKKSRFVHTLNGSGVALARTVIALLERHQNRDGSVTLPKALVPYMDGMERLTPPA
jgi:seryl-tRNA synthetase